MVSSGSEATYGDPNTRERILDATWELVEKSGSAIKIAEIAAQAGVSRQAVYLHFGDRSGLLVAVVDHIDKNLGSVNLREHVFGAPSGVEALQRWVETMSWYTAKIDRVTEVMESRQYEDSDLATAWRNRMNRRQDLLRYQIAERLEREGQLATAWTARTAAEIIYVVTMPGPWRELTRELGWTPSQYSDHIWGLLKRGLLVEDTGTVKG